MMILLLVVFVVLLQWSSLFESSNNTAVVLAFTSRSSSSSSSSSDDARTKKLNHRTVVLLLRASSSSSPSTSSSRSSYPIERVAIIGGGIAGLSFANALLSSTTTSSTARSGMVKIDTYESRSDFEYERGGSGIQLTGGLSALRAISPVLQRRVCDASLPLGKVISHCRPWFSGSSSKERTKEGGSRNDDDDDDGWKILELNVRQTIRDEHDNNIVRKTEADASADDKQQHALVTDDGEILAYTIMRGTLQRMLHNHLITEHYDGKECITFDKRLSGISYVSSSSSSSSFVDANDDDKENNGNEQGIICEFDDGTKAGPYDIVVGCDGIRSVVRQYINTGRIITSSSSSSNGGGDGLAIYSGLRITFAIQDDATSSSSSNSAADAAAADNPVDYCQYNQYFGNGAYALTSTYGKGEGREPSRGAFLVYSDEKYVGPFRKKPSSSTTEIDSMSSKGDASQPDENPDWTQDDQSSREHVMSVLQSSQVPGYDAISDIVRNSDRFFDLGVFLHNPFSWNGWVREVVQQKSAAATTTMDDNDLSKNMKGLFGDSSNENTGRFVVTVGDASHAMPPFLGQGANQALQDSYTLAAKIHEYNTQFEQLQYLSDDDSSNTKLQSDLKTLLKEYENRRWMPTTSITAKAAFLGYLEVHGNWFRDVFFFVMGKIGVVKKVFLDAATPKM